MSSIPAPRTIFFSFLVAATGCTPGALDDSPDADTSIPDPGGGFDPVCRSCHGDETSPAPPHNLAGETEISARGVGAHRSHLDPQPLWHRVIECSDCHQVPAEVGAPGHMDDGDSRAELSFGGMASFAGVSPSFEGTTCSGTYCHGTTLTGGALTTPDFMRVDGSQAACGSCHGAPPPPPHDQSPDCGSCHPTIQPGSLTFLDPDRHIDGVVDLGDGAACDSCHGSGGISAPPRALDGSTEITARGVGAHRAHLGPSTWRREITCANCHVVPTAVDSPGHVDGDNQAEVPFDALNPAGLYTAGNATCSNLYCHGNGRANSGTMVWNQGATLDCNSCHGTTGGQLGGEHGEHIGEEGIQCVDCHQTVVDAQRNVIGAALHINGARDVSILTGGTYDPANRTCTNLACHGNERW